MASTKNKKRNRPPHGTEQDSGVTEVNLHEEASLTDNEDPAAPIKPVQVARQSSLELDRIGDILKRAREQRREKLQNIAEYLRIRTSYLHALEESHYEELPADAYVIGFLRTYANYLGLDGRVAIDHYRKEMAGRRRKPQLAMPQPISEGQTPSATVLFGALGLVFVIYILWYMFSGTDVSEIDTTPALPATSVTEPATPPAENAVPANLGATPTEQPSLAPSSTLTPAPATEQQPAAQPAKEAPKTEAPKPVEQPVAAPTTKATPKTEAPKAETPKAVEQPAATQPAPAPTPAPAPAPKKAEKAPSTALVVRADKESWVLIVDAKGSTVFDRVLKPGETYKVPDQKGLRLTTGNAGGISLSVNDAELPKLGEPFRVIRSVDLDAERQKSQANSTSSELD